MRHTSIVSINSILKFATGTQTQVSNGKWVPARPCGFSSWRNRLHATWLVFTGKADALIWEDQ